MELKSIKLVLPKNNNIQPKDFNGVRFEGSLDGQEWTTILTEDEFTNKRHHKFKREDDFDPNLDHAYSYIRMVHDDSSGCQVNRIKFKGRILKVPQPNLHNVKIKDGFNQILLVDAIRVVEDKTPHVN